MRLPTGAARLLFALGCVVAILVSTHIFFAVAGRAPYVAVDDSLMNVSVTLAEHGRYAFLASPMQGGGTIPRSDVFYNYGPWYFLAGAALEWLFGTSLVAMRYLHPLGLIAIAAIAVWTFRRRSLAAGAIIASGLLVTFWRFQWPMVRPDIAVSVMAALGMAAATDAIRTGRWSAWCLSGAAIAAAVIQHQIAWALAPGLIVLWALNWAARRGTDAPPLQSALRSFVALAGGAAAVVVVFLAMIRFHVTALIDLLFSYSAFVHDINPQPFGAIFDRHAVRFWNAIPAELHVLLPLAGAVCLAATIAALARPSDGATARLAWAAPPIVMFGAYLLGLGLYPNFHSGYVILSQVTAIWTLGAAWCVFQDAASRLRPAVADGFDAAGTAAMGALLLWQAWGLHANPPWIVAAAGGNVPFEALKDRILGPLPAHASVWGPVVLGLGSGTRVDLVQFREGPMFLRGFQHARTAALAPAFIILGNQERAIIRTPPADADRTNTLFPQFDPPVHYRLVALTDAPPYGLFETYARTDLASEVTGPPAVSVNDGTTPQWRHSFGAPLAVGFAPAGPVAITLGTNGPREGANRAVRSEGDVAAGTYLIELRLTHTSGTHMGSILGLPAPEVAVGFSDMGLQLMTSSGATTTTHLAQADYLPGEAVTYLLVRHEGGPLYLAQFDAAEGALFAVASVRRLAERGTPPQRQPVAIPPLESWAVLANPADVSAKSNGAFNLTGDASTYGYQLISPWIKVPAHRRATLSLPVAVRAGTVAVGVLGEDERWILPAAGAITGRFEGELAFDTGVSRKIRIVVANYQTGTNLPRTHFSVRPGRLSVDDPSLYMDRLTACQRMKYGIDTDSDRRWLASSGLSCDTPEKR